ncbi:MAG: hypothetical protein BVN32_07250 [Proteobacteria bacterium ST_bin14]|nr:MAG: hypothetical protein BVN32_07250 [Proteobacteria bacterium ST_bin14]
MLTKAILATMAVMLIPAAATAQRPPPTIMEQPKPKPIADAPEAPVNGVTYLYSATQKCPTDTDGNEITVCVRRSPSEQFRIPKELRPDTLKPEYESWALRGSQTVAEIGRSGIGSCSTEGAGGATGCATQAFEAARRENRARKAAQAANGPK